MQFDANAILCKTLTVTASALLALSGKGHPGISSHLVGGQLQCAALARTLSPAAAPCWALDEPFAALGPTLRMEMLDFVDSIRRQERCTVLLVSHLPGDARRIASRASFLHEGSILCEAPVDEMLDNPPMLEVRHYLGLPVTAAR